MLYDYLGNVTFLRGITGYLSKHEYGNAVTDELCMGLSYESVLKLPVTSMMNTWTKQAGYPLVSWMRMGLYVRRGFSMLDYATSIPT